MKAEGREYWGVHVAPGHGQHHQEKILDQHTANTWKAAQESMKKSILESGLLENKPMTVFSFVLKGEELEQYMRHKGHNQAVEAVKELISNMDTNSVDSIHSNKQAN